MLIPQRKEMNENIHIEIHFTLFLSTMRNNHVVVYFTKILHFNKRC